MSDAKGPVPTTPAGAQREAADGASEGGPAAPVPGGARGSWVSSRTLRIVAVLSLVCNVLFVTSFIVDVRLENLVARSEDDEMFDRVMTGLSLRASRAPQAAQEGQETRSKQDDPPLLRQKLHLDRTRFPAISQVTLLAGSSAESFLVSFVVEEPVVERESRTCTSLKNVSFRVQVWAEALASAPLAATAQQTGCLVSQTTGKYAWHYFVAQVRGLEPSLKYTYEVGQRPASGTMLALAAPPAAGVFRASMYSLPASNQPSFIVVGDTGNRGRGEVVEAIAKEIDAKAAAFLLHVGDMAYVSDKGECWKPAEQVLAACTWSCKRDEDCRGRSRVHDNDFKAWAKFSETFAPVASRVRIVTTMGNHDNDVQWFHRFRPALSAGDGGTTKSAGALARIEDLRGPSFGAAPAAQQAVLNELLAEPNFFSVDAGPVHVVSIQTEDNAINPYERATNAPLSDADVARFEAHFGEESPQYKWLEADLQRVDRSRTPWVVLVSHRPYFSTSSHHANCAPGGDWFKCLMRRLYAPLMEKYHVNLIVNGHSHHYSRTAPLAYNPSTGQATPAPSEGRGFPTYVIIGTGGYALQGSFLSHPSWLAARDGNHFGYATLRVDSATQLDWTFEPVSSEAAAEADHASLKRPIEENL